MLCHHATDARRPRHTSYVLCPPDDSGSAGRNCRAIAIQSQRHVLYDTNFWKTFVHSRLAVPLGDAGCLALFGRDPARHRMFADHLTAEFFVRTAGRGRVFYTAIGHRTEIFWNPTVLRFYLDGIQFAIGDLKAAAEPLE